MSVEKRVMIRWANHFRDGQTGVVVGYEETMMGPMVRVWFEDGREGLFQHEYLAVVPSTRENPEDYA